jgi:hypothetical protein
MISEARHAYIRVWLPAAEAPVVGGRLRRLASDGDTFVDLTRCSAS